MDGVSHKAANPNDASKPGIEREHVIGQHNTMISTRHGDHKACQLDNRKHPSKTSVSILVCMRMVRIVLDPPRLKGIQQRHEGESAHDVFHEFVLAKAAMAAVMPNHKELHSHRQGGSGDTGALPRGIASHCWCIGGNRDAHRPLMREQMTASHVTFIDLPAQRVLYSEKGADSLAF